jgi:transposase-like protein
MIACPHCHRSTQQVKNGRTPAGSQRYLCRACCRKPTPAPRPQGYGADLRRRAVPLDVDGMTLRRIGRTLGVVHQPVANWVAAHADALPAQPPAPAGAVKTAERAALYTFGGEKKTSPTSSRR